MSVKAEDPIIARLLAENEEYKKLSEQHFQFESKVEALTHKKHLTIEEDYELKQLKKMKLAGKDKMERIIYQAKAGIGS